jgi:polyisoprenoid-binding protein YceI
MSTTTVIAAPTGLDSWGIDTAHSEIAFSVKHLAISRLHGRFARWTGSLAFEQAHPERAQVEVKIESASIDTHDPKRDAHLNSFEFLDTQRFPEIVFRSGTVEKSKHGHFDMKGDLSIAGVTRAVTLDVEITGHATDPWGAQRTGFTASTSIDRRDFGLVWNQVLEAGGLLVGEMVEIRIELEAFKRTAAPGTPAA